MHKLLTPLFLTFLILFLPSCTQAPPNPAPSNPSQPSATLGTCTFTLEEARTSSEIQKGLMFRTEMPKLHGMLFYLPSPITPEGKYGFYMKNMRIPLDMVFLNKDKQVLSISSSVPICTQDPCPNYYPTQGEAWYVLELNASQAEKCNILPGQNLQLSN